MKIANLQHFVHDLARRLYEHRRQGMPQEGNRNRLTVGLCMLLLAILACYFVIATTSTPDPMEYLKNRSRIVIPDWQELHWQVRQMDCGKSCNPQVELATKATWIPLKDLKDLNQLDAHRPLHLKLTLPRAALKGLSDYLTITLTVPGLRYFEAQTFVEHKPHRAFYLNRKFVLVLQPKQQIDAAFTIEFFLVPDKELTKWFDPPRLSEPIYLATQAEMEEFEAYTASQAAGKGSWSSVMTRMVLALFVLLFFMIIDSSPESLGLALAMGFDAAATILANKWMPVNLFGSRLDLAIAEGLTQISLVMQLYFITQLTRLAPKKIGPWIIASAVIALVFGTLRYYNAVSITNRDLMIWTQWRLLLSCIGLAILSLGLVGVARKKLPWRVMALSIAFAATMIKIISLALMLAKHDQTATFTHVVINLLQPNIPFMIVASTFLNISTLEERVKQQSIVLAEARELEHELEIGRRVQESLHRIPEFPDTIGFNCFYEAKSYVSGDTFFTTYLPSSNRFVLILLDVTGHGIQAALKASACQAIAATLYRDNTVTVPGDNLIKYREQVTAYLEHANDQPDVTAFTGFELDTLTGELKILRTNYLAPLIIERYTPDDQGPRSASGKKLAYSSDSGVAREQKIQAHQASQWRVHSLPMPNETLHTYQIPAQSYVLLFSDGFIDSSITVAHLIRYLRAQLQREENGINIHSLRSLILESEVFRKATADDRTCLLLYWHGQRQGKRRSVG